MQQPSRRSIKEEESPEKMNYIAILKIPKINLERGLVDPNSYLNDVKYNVEILDESSMPDEIGGNVILASHSGTARISYFKNLT
jgi:sortase (surface protein transpeptidase)